MTEFDAYQLPDLGSEETVAGRLDLMTDTVQLADRTGVFATLPTTRDQAYREELHPSRVLTIRTRLHLLGYLRKDNGSPRIGEKMRRAIARFQAEAGIEVDRWVGDQTWTALAELVDFESSSDMTRWTQDETAHRALWRAVRLRLFVLGFLESRTIRSARKMTNALAEFSAISWSLGCTAVRLPARLCTETLSALFDQDGLVERLARAGAGFAYRLPDEMGLETLETLVRRFIVSVAAIELWLLGYDVPLDGSGRYSRPRKFPYSKRTHPMYSALERFWRARGQKQARARETARRVDGDLFRELQAVELDAERGGPPLDSEVVYREIEALGKKSQRSVWDHIKAIGSRLWDGIKRIWRWIKAALRRARGFVRRVVDWTRSLARLAYSYAKTSFAAVLRAVGRIAGSISFLLHRNVPGSDRAHLVIRRDADLDYTLVAHDGRNAEITRSVAANLARQARFFAAGVRVLSLVVGVVIRTLAKITWAGGWFVFILSLARTFRDLKRLAGALSDDLAILTAPAM
jgi:hypothetical protein